MIFAEYAMDVADACHARGVKTVAVTAGYMHDAPRREFYAKMDAANVDLKAFTDEFYFKLCGAHLQPVLDTLVYLKHETDVWFEITTLLIPGKNDSVEEITADVRVDHARTRPRRAAALHGVPSRLQDERPAADAAGDAARARAKSRSTRDCTTSTPATCTTPKAAPRSARSCRAALIVRDWHQINSYDVTPESKCPHCATTIAGEFEVFNGQFGRRRIPVAINRR